MNSKEKSNHDASKVVKFLTKDPTEIDKKINEAIKKLLREYSHIPEEKILGHVLELVSIRKRLSLTKHSVSGEAKDASAI